MNASPIPLRRIPGLLAVLAILSLHNGFCADAPDSSDEQGGHVLTRGPVHEAFAAVIAYKPEPGMIIAKEPPDIIEEIPPDQKPEGENVTWIPGYWAWDDERDDFLWVSGIWRALPPGRQWVAGYWGKAKDGYQWTSGYWADIAAGTTTYLPSPPPATLENGPSAAAPVESDIWVPGSWVWVHHRYAWSPGYWLTAQADWVWSPGYYIWTPHGYVFVDGYWDYAVARRGVLFAPVYFEPAMRVRTEYRYSPRIVIDLDVLPNHLFLRPRERHYYFGDYYAATYVDRGFYASFAYQSRGYGYDPIYAHQRWEHREDRAWEKHFEARYENRRDHENVRPVRTWAAQKGLRRSPAAEESKPVAVPFARLAKNGYGQRRFQPLGNLERQQLGERGRQVKGSREKRRALEANPIAQPAAKTGAAAEPSTLELPKSPIMSRPANPKNARDRVPAKPGGRGKKGQRGDHDQPDK